MAENTPKISLDNFFVIVNPPDPRDPDADPEIQHFYPPGLRRDSQLFVVGCVLGGQSLATAVVRGGGARTLRTRRSVVAVQVSATGVVYALGVSAGVTDEVVHEQLAVIKTYAMLCTVNNKLSREFNVSAVSSYLMGSQRIRPPPPAAAPAAAAARAAAATSWISVRSLFGFLGGALVVDDCCLISSLPPPLLSALHFATQGRLAWHTTGLIDGNQTLSLLTACHTVSTLPPNPSRALSSGSSDAPSTDASRSTRRGVEDGQTGDAGVPSACPNQATQGGPPNIAQLRPPRPAPAPAPGSDPSAGAACLTVCLALDADLPHTAHLYVVLDPVWAGAGAGTNAACLDACLRPWLHRMALEATGGEVAEVALGVGRLPGGANDIEVGAIVAAAEADAAAGTGAPLLQLAVRGARGGHEVMELPVGYTHVVTGSRVISAGTAAEQMLAGVRSAGRTTETAMFEVDGTTIISETSQLEGFTARYETVVQAKILSIVV